MEDKPWRNEELRSREEGLPRLREEKLERAAMNYTSTTGVGCDGVHFKVPLDLSEESRGTLVKFFEKGSSVGDGRNKLA